MEFQEPRPRDINAGGGLQQWARQLSCTAKGVPTGLLLHGAAGCSTDAHEAYRREVWEEFWSTQAKRDAQGKSDPSQHTHTNKVRDAILVEERET